MELHDGVSWLTKLSCVRGLTLTSDLGLCIYHRLLKLRTDVGQSRVSSIDFVM